MRIRKPSIAVLSSSPREKPGAASFTDEYEEKIEKKDFLLPLVAAEVDLAAPVPGLMPEIHTRPAHNWRNVLLGCNKHRDAVQADREGDKQKPNYRSNGILRIGEDKMRLLTGEGAYVKEDRSSKAEVVDRDWDVPKLGLLEKSLASIGHAKRKRSSVERCGNAERKKQIAVGVRQDYAGSHQCRRRNGRGWRCPERTLVGYSLCEHHLGRGRGRLRLRCVNEEEEEEEENGGGGVVVNSSSKKGTKFKELRLIEAACNSEDHLSH